MYDINAESAWIRRKIRSANIPVRYIGWSLADLSPYSNDVEADIGRWLQDLREGRVLRAEGQTLCGRGLRLTGPPGAGKTALAVTVLQEAIRLAPAGIWEGLERPGYFVTYPEYLMSLQKSYDGEEASLENTVMGTGLLVLDDLGKEHKTSSGWSENTFDALLRIRYDKGLPTILTTNVPKSKWSAVYGEAMESFAHEALASLVIMSPEGDRRK